MTMLKEAREAYLGDRIEALGRASGAWDQWLAAAKARVVAVRMGGPATASELTVLPFVRDDDAALMLVRGRVAVLAERLAGWRCDEVTAVRLEYRHDEGGHVHAEVADQAYAGPVLGIASLCGEVDGVVGGKPATIPIGHKLIRGPFYQYGRVR